MANKMPSGRFLNDGEKRDLAHTHGIRARPHQVTKPGVHGENNPRLHEIKAPVKQLDHLNDAKLTTSISKNSAALASYRTQAANIKAYWASERQHNFFLTPEQIQHGEKTQLQALYAKASKDGITFNTHGEPMIGPIHADDPIVSGEDRFNYVEHWMYEEMMKNAHYEVGRMRWENQHYANPAADVEWFADVHQGGKWDHKPQIEKMVGGSLNNLDSLYFHIPGRPNNELLFYDVWSNLHYGYVGMQAGFNEHDLMWAQNSGLPGVGANDDGDNIVVQAGIDMWKHYGINMTFDQYDNGVHTMIQQLQDAKAQGEEVPQFRYKGQG